MTVETRAHPGHWFRTWMPYTFEKLSSGDRKHIYLPVNRDRKPLGVRTEEFVDYEAFHQHAVEFSSDPGHFKDVWIPGRVMYLYEDDPNTLKDYFVRLDRLTKRSMLCVEPAAGSEDED